jgi:hypothetical protein
MLGARVCLFLHNPLVLNGLRSSTALLARFSGHGRAAHADGVPESSAKILGCPFYRRLAKGILCAL